MERLSRLVSDVLGVARLQQDRLRLDVKDVDVARLAQEAAEAFAEAAREAGVARTVEAADPVPARVDPHRVTQVRFNLLSNALRFTPREGEVRVRVRADGTSRARGRAWT